MIRSLHIRIFILILVTVGAVWVASTLPEYEAVTVLVGKWGYIGLFLISIISGFNLISPIPAVSFVPVVVVAGLSFWPAIAIVTIGMTIGDAIGVFLGQTGRGVFDEWIRLEWLERIQAKLSSWKLKPTAAAFLYAAFVPLPNELLLIPLAFIYKRGVALVAATFLGNIVFNTVIAGALLGIVSLV